MGDAGKFVSELINCDSYISNYLGRTKLSFFFFSPFYNEFKKTSCE